MTSNDDLIARLESLVDLGPLLRSVKFTPAETFQRRGLVHVVVPSDDPDPVHHVFDRLGVPLPTLYQTSLPAGERLLGWEVGSDRIIRLKLYSRWTKDTAEGELVRYRTMKWQVDSEDAPKVVDYRQNRFADAVAYLGRCLSRLPDEHRADAQGSLTPLIQNALSGGDEPMVFLVEVDDDRRQSFDLNLGGLRRRIGELGLEDWLSRVAPDVDLRAVSRHFGDHLVSRLVAGVEDQVPFLTLYLLPLGDAP
jgi:hypothetical protein